MTDDDEDVDDDVDIQEFYDTTLLDESKSVQQKTTETLQIVAKWEQTLTIAGGVPQPQTTLQTEVQRPARCVITHTTGANVVPPYVLCLFYFGR